MFKLPLIDNFFTTNTDFFYLQSYVMDRNSFKIIMMSIHPGIKK
jgi:hypothetical protein